MHSSSVGTPVLCTVNAGEVILGQMGDKLTAETIAHACDVPTISGTAKPLDGVDEVIDFAQKYGYITRIGSHVFFNGMVLGATNKMNIEDGKTLVIKYLGLGDLNEDSTRNVLFELNGMRREVAVPGVAYPIVVSPRNAEKAARLKVQ